MVPWRGWSSCSFVRCWLQSLACLQWGPTRGSQQPRDWQLSLVPWQRSVSFTEKGNFKKIPTHQHINGIFLGVGLPVLQLIFNGCHSDQLQILFQWYGSTVPLKCEITILDSLLGLFVFLFFGLFVSVTCFLFFFLSGDHSDQMSERSQVSKVNICNEILKWQSLTHSMNDQGQV